MRVAFEHDLSHNYVIPEMEEEVKAGSGQETEYELHMLEENQIPGFMECVRKNINGRNRYYYEITSRQSLAQICETESLTAQSIRILLQCLYQALQQLEPYLLDGNRIVLEPELIYLDVESRETAFCYWPLWDKTIQDSFRIFASYLLYHLEQTDTEAVLMMYEINRKVQEKNYALLELLRERVQTANLASQSELHYTETRRATLEKTPHPPLAQECLGEESEQQRCNLAVEGRSYKEKWWRRFHNTEKKDCSSKKERMHEKASAGRGTEQNKSNLAAGVIFLVVLGIVGVAVRMEILTITQAGGIAFLIIGGMAYVLSPENKRRKKKAKEEKEEKETAKINWEMPEHIPTAHERESPKEELMGATTVLWEGKEEYQPHLTLISMNAKERNSVVLLNDSYLIGKLKNKVDIYIDDASISRIHAKLQKENEEYYLCDMNSTNGTFLNGRRLGIQEKVPIHVADEITFADLGYYVGNC